ncbi:MAG: SH3 domain-containing protein [Anaerolineaceae bacterium]|nr:SH3 domain-containing protein [Anaerolineaceae bacterium]
MRKWFLFTLFGFILLAAGALLPVQAQNDQWAAWLFDSSAAQMVYITGATGAIDAVTLPLPAPDYTVQRVAVGHRGSPFAYVASNDAGFARLMVTERDRVIIQQELPLTFSDSLEFVTGSAPFNGDDTTIALGYSLLPQGWEIVVVDLRTQATTHVLRSNDPLAMNNRLDFRPGVTPVIREFNGSRVVFTLVLAGSEGAGQYQSFTWHLDTLELTVNEVYPTLDSDRFATTGEVIMALSDERLPATPENFPFFQANTLHVYDPASASRYPFFYVTDLNLYRPRFIQNGEWILVSGDGITATGDQTLWMVIGRDGQIGGTLPSTVTMDSVWGLGNGFLYTTGGFSPGATTLVYAYTRNGLNAGAPVYISDAGQTLDIAWAGDTGTVESATYVPWTQFAEPIYIQNAAPPVAQLVQATPVIPTQVESPTPQALVVPSLAPISSFNNTVTAAPLLIAPSLTPPPVAPGDVTVAAPAFGATLHVGGLATVQTTQGDRLNMRLSPGLDAPVVARLDSGARLTIVDGPRTVSGFVWWKVRAANGVEGWAVESVEEDGVRLQTLLPY